jgi:hypothetical protein
MKLAAIRDAVENNILFPIMAAVIAIGLNKPLKMTYRRFIPVAFFAAGIGSLIGLIIKPSIC